MEEQRQSAGDERRAQEVFKAGTGMAVSNVVTRCNRALTGHEVGRCRRIRSLYCLTCVATLNRVRMHGAGLGRGEGRVGEGMRAEGMVEHIGGAGEQEPRGVGQERRGRGAVTVEVTLDRLDIVFAIPPRTVEVFIHVLGRGRL